MKGLVIKILKGTYAPIASHYSDNLRNLIAEMLTKDPAARPSIKTILQKDFIFVSKICLYQFNLMLCEESNWKSSKNNFGKT